MALAARNFLKARRDRLLGTVLGYAEREVYHRLSPDEQDAFRSLVLSAVDQYHDAVLDLFKSDSGDMVNEEAIELLRRIDRRLPV